MFLDDAAARPLPSDEQSAAVGVPDIPCGISALLTLLSAQGEPPKNLLSGDVCCCARRLPRSAPRLDTLSGRTCSSQPRLQRLFDSSRFNYDSDEEEKEEQQRGAAAEAGEQQQQRPAASPGEEGDGGVLEVPLPPPRGVRVKTAEFIKSSVNVAQCPPPRFPEFAGGWVGKVLCAGMAGLLRLAARHGTQPALNIFSSV